MPHISKFLFTTAVATALALVGAPAEANAGLPMLMVVWPAMWLLLIPIIMLEAAIGVQVLHVEFLQATKIAAVANLVSTLVGVPITWLVLLIVELKVGKGGGVYGIDTLRGRILSVTLQSPWLLPYEQKWIVPAAELFLCIPFFLMSVWTEFISANWFTQGKLPVQELLAWSWLGNGLSYGMIAGIVLLMLLRALRDQKPIENHDQTKWEMLVSAAALSAMAVSMVGVGLASLIVEHLLGGHPKSSGPVDREKEVSLWGPEKTHSCSFCSRAQASVGKIIAGPGVYICNICATEFAAQLAAGTGQRTEAESIECNFCRKIWAGAEVVGGSDKRICRECLEHAHEILIHEHIAD